MTEPATIVDPSTSLRDWLRTAGTDVAARVYLDGFPKAVTLPAAVLSRIGGPIASPLDIGLWALEVRGATQPETKTAAYELVTFLESAAPETLDDCRFCGATTASLNTVSDPDDPTVYRMTATVQITTKVS